MRTTVSMYKLELGRILSHVFIIPFPEIKYIYINLYTCCTSIEGQTFMIYPNFYLECYIRINKVNVENSANLNLFWDTLVN